LHRSPSSRWLLPTLLGTAMALCIVIAASNAQVSAASSPFVVSGGPPQALAGRQTQPSSYYPQRSNAMRGDPPQSPALAWLPSRTDGLGQDSLSIGSLASYGERVYAGAVGGSASLVLVWSYDEAGGWQPSSAPGFGGTNTAVRAMAVYGDLLYAATENAVSGAQVWSSTGGGWGHVADRGILDTPANTAIPCMAIHRGLLYAGTRNASGAQLYSYDGANWTRVLSGGLGYAGNVSLDAMAVVGERLYVAMGNVSGAQLWYRDGDADWSRALVFPPHAPHISALAVFQDRLYIATSDDAARLGEIWCYDGDTYWRSAQPGFGDSNNEAVLSLAVHGNALYAGTLNRGTLFGAQVWLTEGEGWWPSTKTGFLNHHNQGISALTSVADSLWAGTENAFEGAGLWNGKADRLSFTVASRPVAVLPQMAVRYDIRVTNHTTHTFANMRFYDTWESRDECAYNPTCDPDCQAPITVWLGDLGPGESDSGIITLYTHSYCAPQVITNTVRLQGDNLAPMYMFATTVISPALTPTPTPTFAPQGPFTRTFQQGLSGYAGAADTYIYQGDPTRRYCDQGLINVGYQQQYAGLLRFDLTALPGSTNVLSASLRLSAVGHWEPDRDISVGAFVVSRTVDVCQATWAQSRLGEAWALAGCNSTAADRRPNPESTFTTAGIHRSYAIDVTQAVRGWVDASLPNNGLLLRSLDVNSQVLLFASGEYSEITLRPELIVVYLTGPTPTATSTQTPTSTQTATRTLSPTVTRTPTRTATPSHTPTRTGTPSRTPTTTSTSTLPTTPTASPSPTATSTATTTLTPVPTCPDRYEPNDGFEQAWPLGWGGHVESYICTASDVDDYWADITAQPYQGFRITLGNLPADYDLYLYNAVRMPIGASARPGLVAESITVFEPAVYIRVTGASGAYDRLNPYHLDIVPITQATDTPTPSPTPTQTGFPSPTQTPTGTPTMPAPPSPTTTPTATPTAPGARWSVYLPLVLQRPIR